MRKILVLRGGALGDFIVTLPALGALRRKWPHAVIELAGNATAAELAVRCGLLDRVHSQAQARWASLYGDAPLPATFAAWLGEFDLVVSFWPDPEHTLARRFPAHAGQRFITASAMPTRAPAAAHYLAALAPLEIDCGPLYYELDRSNGAGRTHTIAIHPGSGSRRKNWPADRWIKLMARLPSPLLLVTGEAEEGEWTEATLRATPLAERLCDGSLQFAAKLPLEELAGRLRDCRLFVGHDSGVTHLAAACGVASIVLFGPTDPAVWAPPAPHVRVLRRGTELEAISVEDVREAVRRELV